MKHRLFHLYQRLVLDHPVWALAAVLLISAAAAWQVQNFHLDASADSLTLENDEDLAYYRKIADRYGGSDFLIVTYTPKDRPLFARPSLDHLQQLRNDLGEVDRVASVYSLLDVPLLFSPPVEFGDLTDGYRTLLDDNVDLDSARAEFTRENPLYRELLVSKDGKTTAMLVNFERNEEYHRLLDRRKELRRKARAEQLDDAGRARLDEVEQKVSDFSTRQQQRTAETISTLRTIMDDYRDEAQLFMGGVPMIASDMVRFIRDDLRTFGLGVLIFIVLTLWTVFRRPRWVAVPLTCCALTVLWMVGWLGLMDWKVTVISSNFISLLLIITLSITIHLTVRYRELHAEHPEQDQRWLVGETLRHMVRPIVYTVLTTMVAFSSLVVSDIRPVIDFGWMMTIGIGVALVLSLVLFPSLLKPLRPGQPRLARDYTRRMTLGLAGVSRRYTPAVLVLGLAIALVALWGTTRLTVENRFIDYFNEDTEIYQGMLRIDQKLGGTTPVDIIINAPEGAAAPDRPFADGAGGSGWGDQPATRGSGSTNDGGDPFSDNAAGAASDPFANPDTGGNKLEDAYWYTPGRLEKLIEITQYLESMPETGKVLSVATTYQVAKKLNDGPLSHVQLMLLTTFIPDNLQQRLVEPYMSEDGDQVRISMRVRDSYPGLNRNQLLEKIRTDLANDFGLDTSQVRLTGAMVLYNNMLQSLYDSQIKTLGFVFLAIMGMFLVLFRSLYIAVIAMLPNLFSAAFVLGLMGWVGLPLDMMTITIAAITIGIAVDDTIHYIHRFREELPVDNDYVATMRRCHASTGKAMYYTTLTITVGFSILALSNFNPTVYFGLLTGLAMLVALVANLTLLPALMITLKPRVPQVEE
jgi:predicted RND superfamily exporter protein